MAGNTGWRGLLGAFLFVFLNLNLLKVRMKIINLVGAVPVKAAMLSRCAASAAIDGGDHCSYQTTLRRLHVGRYPVKGLEFPVVTHNLGINPAFARSNDR